MSIRVFKIIIDEFNYTIVHITEQFNDFLFQYYDNGSPVHRLRETLEFKNMNDAVRFLYADNDCYEIKENFIDKTTYY